ncbi:hypothetical protein D3C72_1984430 [compost metagenome]
MLPVRRDAEVDDPPAAHLELHPFDAVVPVAEVLGHLGPGGQAVAVLGHVAVDRDGCAIDRLAFRGLEVDRPLVEL